MVVFGVHEVNGGAGHLDTGFQHRLVHALSVEAVATEGGDQGRVRVDGASVELPASLEG